MLFTLPTRHTRGPLGSNQQLAEGFLPGPNLQEQPILNHKLKEQLVFRAMPTITNAPFTPAGDTFQDHVSKKTQRQVPNDTDSAY